METDRRYGKTLPTWQDFMSGAAPGEPAAFSPPEPDTKLCLRGSQPPKLVGGNVKLSLAITSALRSARESTGNSRIPTC